MDSKTFQVMAILTANASQFTAGMREAQESIEAFKRETLSISSISETLGAVGKAMTASITLPVMAGVTSVVKSYADLEQAVGGVQTLFKDSANNVISNSETAYKRAGVSGVKYMEQVTSFSATLLQGLGGDTAKAAEYADKAVVQMSDNANKFGTNIGEIQHAYQGFAKDNYTMLDNLKLGYGGTQEEMARLVNESGVLGDSFQATAENVKDIPFSTLIDAIQVTQDRLGVTGTTAHEASTTVSGSFSTMVAAGENLVAGLGSSDADVKTLITNLKDSFVDFAGNVKGVLKNLWNNLPMAEWQKWVLAIATGAGPILIALSGVVKGITGIGNTIKGVGAILSNPFGLALVAIVALVAGLVYAYQHSETFRNIVNSAIEKVVATFESLKAKAQPVFDWLSNTFSSMNAGAFAPLVGGIGLAIAAFMKLKSLKISLPSLPNPFSKLAGFAKGASTMIKGVFSGLGKAIPQVFKGIASSISTVFQGIAKALSSLNPVGVLAFAGGLAAVTVALIALSAVQGMVLPFLQGLATILVSLVSGVLQAFANALVTLAPVMVIMATALSALSPLVVAIGLAFAIATPAIYVLSSAIVAIVSVIMSSLPAIITAISGLVTAFSTGVATIITALTPIVAIIGRVFIQIVQIVSNAIVQIVQALAPFIPSITEMVVALAPVLQSMVEAFTTLVTQISPIIDSISNLFKTLGEQISNILDSASGVITSFGDSVRTVLDGVAGIFDSMGNAALNAGKGVKQMAQGIKILVDLKLGDLVATLAAVATGLGNMATHASGLAELGTGMMSAGRGMTMIAMSATIAVAGMTQFSTGMTTLSTAVTSLPALLSTAGASFASFTAQAVAGVAGLSAINAPIASVKAQVMTITPALVQSGASFAMFGTSALVVTASLAVLSGLFTGLAGTIGFVASGLSQAGASATSTTAQLTAMANGTRTVVTAFNTMRSQVQSSMQATLSVVKSAGTQMVSAGRQIGQRTAQNIALGIRSGQGQATSAMASLINATRSVGTSGAGTMRYIGAMIGQGLAQGMYSALGAVTAAANALVAQAERAAQAKAKIHSPSRLFRDNVGIYIGQGVAVGIDKSQKFVDKAMTGMFDGINQFNTQINDMMGNNLAYSFDSGQVNHSVEVMYQRQDSEELGLIKESLETIKELAGRDTVLAINGNEFARATGDDISSYQAGRKWASNRMRGVK